MERMNMFDNLTCETCVNFKRDYTMRAGGWCPIPKNRGRWKPIDPEGKYVYQSRKACKHYKQRLIEVGTKAQDDEIQNLFGLIKRNPGLPIIPMVDAEIVADEFCAWWMGSWGEAKITKFCRGSERVHFYVPDDWESIEAAINDAEIGDFDNDDPSDTELLAAYNNLPWITAIAVYINLPER